MNKGVERGRKREETRTSVEGYGDGSSLVAVPANRRSVLSTQDRWFIHL